MKTYQTETSQSGTKTLIIGESRLRAFQKCSELFHFGGQIHLPIKTALIEFVYLKIILDILRQEHFSYKTSLAMHLTKGVKTLLEDTSLTPNEISEYKRHAAIHVDEIFQILKPQMYVPSFGAFVYPVKVSNSVLKLNVASVLTTNQNTNGGLMVHHAVSFSPYMNMRDIRNDIVQAAKAITLSQAAPFARTRRDRAVFRLHLFGTQQNHELNYTFLELKTKEPLKAWAKYVEQPIKSIERGYHVPINPCPFSCPYKEQCEMNPIRERFNVEELWN